MSEAENFRAPYSEYFKNYTKALEVLQQRKKKDTHFASFLKEASLNPKLKKITLDGFLLIPVQRVMKYPVLLEAVLKYCPESHSEQASLKQAHQLISKVVSALNEDKRKAENIEKIQEIAQGLNFHNVRRILQKFFFFLFLCDACGLTSPRVFLLFPESP